MYSIRSKLLISLLGTVFLVLSISSLLVYFDTKQEINNLTNDQLAQSAHVLFSLIAYELTEKNKEEDYVTKNNRFKELQEHLAFHKYNKLLAFQITVADEFKFNSLAAPSASFSKNTNGFSQTSINHEIWQVYTLYDSANQISIRVADKMNIRNDLVRKVTLHVLTPFMISIPILALLIYLLINRGLIPLKDICNQISNQDISQLASIKSETIPIEIKPMTDALNKLFVRLEKVLEHERNFTSDAAHELRTPLAGLKAQVQVAQKTSNEDVRQNALKKLLLGIDNTIQMLEQLLILARLDPDIGLDKFTLINLFNLITEVVSEMKPHINGKNIEINSPRNITLSGNYSALEIMIRNLLDNAISQLTNNQNGKIQITLEKNTDNIILSIIDNGPGIPDNDKKLVFNRFYRCNFNNTSGSGLGLSIVKRITELHNAEIELKDSSPEPGLKVNIIFQTQT
jgi:signal transduction histidine kinase